MSTSIKKEKNTKYWVNSAIVLFCFFGFGIFPEVFGFTPAAMRAIGIFIGLLWAGLRWNSAGYPYWALSQWERPAP